MTRQDVMVGIIAMQLAQLVKAAMLHGGLSDDQVDGHCLTAVKTLMQGFDQSEMVDETGSLPADVCVVYSARAA
jgi:hypothetical protein